MAFQISRAIDAHQIGYAVAGACALFVVLLLLFELLRTRLYWIYELPRTVNGTGHTGPSEFCATSI